MIISMMELERNYIIIYGSVAMINDAFALKVNPDQLEFHPDALLMLLKRKLRMKLCIYLLHLHREWFSSEKRIKYLGTSYYAIILVRSKLIFVEIVAN